MARNPYFEAQPPAVRPDPFEALLRRVRTHLERRRAEPVIPDAELRALHPALAVPAVWAQVAAALGL